MPGLSKLLGDRLLTHAGNAVVTSEALAGSSAVGLYFSASWCPPCRGFTPTLVESYQKSLFPKGFRCVLVSWDKDEQSFKDYHSKMPWLALPFEESEKKEELGKLLGVRGIPALALLDAQGRTITTEGTQAVSADPAGEHYPWRPPLVRDLAHGEPGQINELPSLICLCEAAPAEAHAGALESLTALATAAQESERSLGFFLGSGGGLSAKIRELCRLPAGGAPRLLLLDIPDNGGFYLGPEGPDALTPAAAEQMLLDYRGGKLTRQQLGPPSE
ncbi:unnamed protein product [Polarella glacialis]|uniref:Thioredoxin domain-containing protein n=1 Tax=Polarella glacialis TaxID=89957 RepID=A0A813EDE8_POLGL|nr:unnamed protein product [Polarella glacialis]CAE8598558.1 unnamed protein product [Polarella glacialis]CAE8683398.1 unnamed protein product [Polarella glacialis]